MHRRVVRLLILSVLLALLTACASAPPPSQIEIAQRTDVLGTVTREPMIAELPTGELFVAGYGRPLPTLWKSTDRGTTWSLVDVGTETEGAIGNSDVDLAVAADGTLYFASMLYDRTANEGRQIAVGVTRDAGKTWHWTTVTKNRFDDRPWIEVAPDGTAHLIWNDGSGVNHAVSRDRGRTWTTARIHNAGGSSHLAIGPRGELAVRVVPLSASGNKFDAGVDLIEVSTDGGATWMERTAPGERDWTDKDDPAATPRWVEPLAWDRSDNLYSLWTEKSGVRLAMSRDRGATWKSSAATQTDGTAFFPYIVSVGPERLVATWFTAADPEWNDLKWHIAWIDLRSGQPRIVKSSALPIESLRVREGKTPRPDTGGEYLAIALLRNGTFAVTTPIQNKPAQRTGFTFWRFMLRP